MKRTGAILMCLLFGCGAPAQDVDGREPVPSNEPGEATSESLSDEDAIAAAERALADVVAPSLRPHRAAIADAWERNLAEPEGQHVERGACRQVAADAQDSITALGTPNSAEQQILYGDLASLSEGDCVSVVTSVGFETLVTVLRPTGELVFVWDVPEG